MLTRPDPCPNWFEEVARPFFERHLLPRFDGSPFNALQLGAFAGDATLWLIERFPRAYLVDVDTWGGSPEHEPMGIDFADVEAYYDYRTASYRPGRLAKMRTTTAAYLVNSWIGSFDFVYVDASHDPLDVVVDAALAFPLLADGGLIAFDDYLWAPPDGSLTRPCLGIDAFRYAAQDRVREVEIGAQVWLEKVA